MCHQRPLEAVKQALLKAVGYWAWQTASRRRDVRPIIVSIKNMRASACYYAASPADAIYADPNAIIGRYWRTYGPLGCVRDYGPSWCG